MSVAATAPIYLRTPRVIDPRRLLAFAAVAMAHVAALAVGFGTQKVVSPPTGQPMHVMFIAQAAAVTPVASRPPVRTPEPTRAKAKPPRRQPDVIATSQDAALQVPQRPAVVERAPPPPPEDVPAAASTPVSSAPAPAAPAVVPPDFVAAYLNNPGPHYPRASVRAHEQGTVMLLVRVGTDGRAQAVDVESSSGYSRLDAAAVDVVRRRWRFVPATQADRAVVAWVRVPITFELKQQH